MLQSKICTKCKQKKPLEHYAKCKSTCDGRRSQCKECACAATKEYVLNNKEKVRKSRKVYYENNKSHIIDKVKAWAESNKEQRKEYLKNYHQQNQKVINKRSMSWRLLNHDQFISSMRNWYQCNKEYCKEYARKNKDRINKKAMERHRKKYTTDPRYKINLLMGTVIRQALKGNKAGMHWELLVGYTVENLKEYIEKQFQLGMTWKNHGSWHIDHIIPKSRFNFTTPEDPEFKQCWALGNLQPMWAEDNLKKGNKIV